MKWIFLLLSIILVFPAYSQRYEKPVDKMPRPNSIGFSLNIPMGSFASSHTIGFGLDYTWSTRSHKKDSVSGKLIHFAVNGGVSYQGGKKTTTAGNEFTYGGYTNVYAMAGIDCKWTAPLIINLFAGPVMSIYKGDEDFGFGVNLISNYSVSPRVAAGPGIQYRKFDEANALWTATLRLSYSF
jgi:hypothetical protein